MKGEEQKYCAPLNMQKKEFRISRGIIVHLKDFKKVEMMDLDEYNI